MLDSTVKTSLRSTLKSKFVRSIIIWMTFIFLVVSFIIVALVFSSFTSEINNRMITERKNQLNTIEKTVSSRFSEISDISFSISTDTSFYYGASGSSTSGEEMCKILERYLVGNDFIEHLAFYRLSEDDTIYVSSGKRSIREFFSAELGLSNDLTEGIVKSIKDTKKITYFAMNLGPNIKSYMAYTCPLPISSTIPQAFVLMLIPIVKLENILKEQIDDYSGEVTVFDTDGMPIYSYSSLDHKLPIDKDFLNDGSVYIEGNEYIQQKAISTSNGWTYVSAIKLNDIIGAVLQKQIVFYIILTLVMITAIFAIVLFIIKQYAPINKIAIMLNDSKVNINSSIDEKSLLSDNIAILKSDSNQKQLFEAAYHEANAANKAKSVFFSNMSHDIRTPMNAIIGMSDIASKHLDDMHYVGECLEKVKTASKYLLDIINNVLDLSRIESGKLSLNNERINLPKMVYGMINILNQSLESKNMRFIVTINDVVNESIVGDKIRLTQILMNMLSNSIKFTNNYGTISFSIKQTVSQKEGYGRFIFTISDNGIGMSKEFMGRLYETFSRDQTTHVANTEGTGLGLSIAKSLIDMMKGTITCNSVQNVGTTFEVTLDLELVQEDIYQDNMDKYLNTNILIIGSESETISNQAKLFKDYGCLVTKALTIDEGLNALSEMHKSNRYFTYLIINYYGNIDGIVAISRIKKLNLIKEMKTIFVAKNVLAIDQSLAYNEGVAMITSIPLFRSTILDILNQNYKRQSTKKAKVSIDLSNLSILLVEDNSINMEIAKKLINETKAKIVTAYNGQEAVSEFMNHPDNYFDLILMDIKMPKMNGFEATKLIRTMQRSDSLTIKIIAMTANTFDEDVRQVKDAGMDGHLGKPYNTEELYEILEKVNNAKKN